MSYKNLTPIHLKDEGEANGTYLVRRQTFELLRTFVEVVPQRHGIVDDEHGAGARPALDGERFRCLEHFPNSREMNGLH